MTANELALRLGAEIVYGGDREINGVYAGDFLSRVMGKAPAGCVWLTIMNNVNVAGVATLAEIAAVALCEGVKPAEGLAEKCAAENITLLSSPLSVYEACLRLKS